MAEQQADHATLSDLLQYDCTACGAKRGDGCEPLIGQKFTEQNMVHSARASAFQADIARCAESTETKG